MVDVQEAKSSKMVFDFKKRFFSLLICLFGLGVHAQKINFSGVIRDSLQQPLAGSSLVAINQETNALDAYTITAEDGIFALQLQAQKKYKIQISALGLQTLNEELTTEEKDIQQDYTLRADIQLDEVVVKMPVLIKGDTLIYDADSFKNGSERKLEDIIDKLPGVEINDNGQIEVEGKVVNKLMVNGKDFLKEIRKLPQKIFHQVQ